MDRSKASVLAFAALDDAIHGEAVGMIQYLKRSIEMAKATIPVTIITGFLGAGKTTFVNQLISDNPDVKFAIIENEFGDISIDKELVINVDDGIYELSSGCICCSLNAELGELLRRLAGDQYNFDHLLIETTGIAEPDGIASAFIGKGKSTRFVLDGTICLADAHDIRANLNERGEAQKQVSFSDAIVLNKSDLVSEDELQGAIESVKEHNQEAKVFSGSYGKVSSNLLSLKAFDPSRLENNFLSPQHDHQSKHDLTSHSFEFSEPLAADKFEHWITMLLFLSGYQLYRIKGVLQIAGEDRKVIFQSVRSNSQITVGSEWLDGEIRKSKIVFIGIGIRRDMIDKGIKGCLAI